MIILRAKSLSLVCTLAVLVCVYDAQGQFPRPKLPGTAPAAPAAAAPPAGPTASDDAAAAQASEECINAADANGAAGLALKFLGGGGGDEAQQSEISKYLVGLCVPAGLPEQYALNEYLLAKGAVDSFYAVRSLEELAAQLDKSGVELGVKFEALQKDSALTAALSASNGLEKAQFIFNQNQALTRQVALFVPALKTLQTGQRTAALGIAARARAHALNSSYLLSRGVYVSQKMVTGIAANAKEQAGGLGNRVRGAGSNPQEAANSVAGAAGALSEEIRSFVDFAKKNGKAIGGALGGMVNVVKTLDPDSTEIPKLAKEDVAKDVSRLNATWDMAATFPAADKYAATNQGP